MEYVDLVGRYQNEEDYDLPKLILLIPHENHHYATYQQSQKLHVLVMHRHQRILSKASNQVLVPLQNLLLNLHCKYSIRTTLVDLIKHFLQLGCFFNAVGQVASQNYDDNVREKQAETVCLSHINRLFKMRPLLVVGWNCLQLRC